MLAPDADSEPPARPAVQVRGFGGGPKAVESDPLLAFRTESDAPAAETPRSTELRRPVEPPRPTAAARPAEPTEVWRDRLPSSGRTWIAIAAAVAALTGGLVYFQAAKRASTRAAAAAVVPPKPVTGTAMFSSQPAGADVMVDGERRGVTPLTIPLSPGEHQVEFVSGEQRRAQPLTISAGATVSQFIEFAARVATNGRIEVSSEPSGAQVTVDGTSRGTTPFVLADVAPGAHTVAVTRGDRTLRRTVTVSPGATATVMMTAPQSAGPEAGWVVFRAPFDMQVLEDGRLLGTTGADRLMLPAGRHELVVLASAYNLRETYAVNVEPGGLAPVSVNVPTSLLSVNAQPWRTSGSTVAPSGRPLSETCRSRWAPTT